MKISCTIVYSGVAGLIRWGVRVCCKKGGCYSSHWSKWLAWQHSLHGIVSCCFQSCWSLRISGCQRIGAYVAFSLWSLVTSSHLAQLIPKSLFLLSISFLMMSSIVLVFWSSCTLISRFGEQWFLNPLFSLQLFSYVFKGEDLSV